MANFSTAKSLARESNILDHAVAIHTEEVNLFTTPPVNIGEEKVMWIEQMPIFQTKGEEAPVQFHIPGTGTQYTDLARTELYLKLKITDENGDPFVQNVETKTAVPIDNILHSMWSMVDIKFNQSLVSTSGTNYMYKSYLETLLNYSQSSKKIQLSSIGFSGDEGNFDAVKPNAEPIGRGISSRYNWFKKITTLENPTMTPADIAKIPEDDRYQDPSCVEFIGPLLADICNQDRLILNGVNIELKLFPNKDTFRLLTSPANTKAHIIIEDCKLYVCKVNVAPDIFLGHHKALEYSPALYPFQRTEIRTFNLSRGSYSTTLEDIWQGEVPNRLIVGMVDSDAFAGDYSRNPFRFKHNNLQNITFFVDSESVPRPPYQLNFKDCNYLEGLLSLYKVSGKLYENTDIGITRETYRQGYSLIGFEVDPTSSADFSYIGKPKGGRTRLTMRFHTGLQNDITIILYATFPEVLEIDAARIASLREKEEILSNWKRNRG